MNPAQPLFNSDGFKGICSGRNCKREPTTRLKIKYLKKVGTFCEQCTNSLIESDLVEEKLSAL
jgi:hypothetical protein